MTERVAIYAGTFDPIHKGHIDIIQRAARTVDRLVIGVALSAGKSPLFDVETRASQVRDTISPFNGHADFGECEIVVETFSGLLVEFARQFNARVIFRGLRAISDFEYEIQMAANNKRLAPEIETVFLMATETHQFTSSRFVKEIGIMGGDISSFVTSTVQQAIVDEAERRRTGV